MRFSNQRVDIIPMLMKTVSNSIGTPFFSQLEAVKSCDRNSIETIITFSVDCNASNKTAEYLIWNLICFCFQCFEYFDITIFHD